MVRCPIREKMVVDVISYLDKISFVYLEAIGSGRNGVQEAIYEMGDACPSSD
jgi:hypothetical protein